MKPLVIALLLCLPCVAQNNVTCVNCRLVNAKLSGQPNAGTLHVTAVRDWTATDAPRASRAFRVLVITGTMDGKLYTTQQLHSWGSQDFHAGEDYPVTKVTDRDLSVVMHDKKGREVKERLDVTGVEAK